MTDKIKVTVSAVTNAMHEAVAAKGSDYLYEQPWFVYDRDGDNARRALGPDESPDDFHEDDVARDCVYVAGGAPSCLVGNVLHMLGVPLDAFGEHEGTSADYVVPSLIEVEEDEDGSVTDTLARALREAQGKQDMGQTWGDALSAYDEKIKEIA